MIFVDRRSFIEWQREYFKLAAAVLSCFLTYRGGRAIGSNIHVYDPSSILVGELSYGAEIYLMIKEARGERMRVK